MTRRLPLATVLAVGVLATALSAPPALASPQAPDASVQTSAWQTPAADATSAGREARELRTETAAMIQRYIDDYGDRVTSTDRARLVAYRATAQRYLTSVVVTTRRLSALVGRGAPRREVVAAGRAAQRAHERARAAAVESYEQARAILEPRMSWLEGLAALRDYDAMLGRFDALGERIDSVVTSYPGA